MTGEVIALGLTLAVHVLGAVVLIGAIARSSGADWRSVWPRDDDGPGGSPRDPAPEPPPPGGGGVPLPDAAPAAVRLREGDRLADGYPRPARRPSHPPEPAQPRDPQRAYGTGH